MVCMGRKLQEKIQMLGRTRVIVREQPDYGYQQLSIPWCPLKTFEEVLNAGSVSGRWAKTTT